MLLAIETATNVCSVVFKDATGEIFEKRTEERGSHSEKLFLFVQELMKEHAFFIDHLDALLVSEGPGSYTGLRIGAAAAKGLLFQIGTPLYTINTLASFAQAVVKKVSTSQKIHSIIDARRVHVYHQPFLHEAGVLSAERDVEIIPVNRFEKMVGEGDIITGTGLTRIDEDVRAKARIYSQEFISGRSLIQLFENDPDGNFIREVDPETFEPKYYTSNQV